MVEGSVFVDFFEANVHIVFHTLGGVGGGVELGQFVFFDGLYHGKRAVFVLKGHLGFGSRSSLLSF